MGNQGMKTSWDNLHDFFMLSLHKLCAPSAYSQPISIRTSLGRWAAKARFSVSCSSLCWKEPGLPVGVQGLGAGACLAVEGAHGDPWTQSAACGVRPPPYALLGGR